MNPAQKRNPTIEELTDRVKKAIEEVTGVQPPTPKTDLADLSIDSMAKLDILTSLEKDLSLELNEAAIEEFKTVARIVRVVGDAIRSRRESAKSEPPIPTRSDRPR